MLKACDILEKCETWADRWPRRIKPTLNSENTIKFIHDQKASCYEGRQFLKMCGFKTSCNDFSLRKTGN